MVAALISLKRTVLRHQRAGDTQALRWTGTIVGVALVALTWWLGLAPAQNPAAGRDLHALALTLWLVGWVVAPVWAGEPILQARHLALLPLSRWRLAVGLPLTSLLSVPGALTLAALLSVTAVAGPRGPIAIVVGVVTAVLLTAAVALAGRLAGHGFGRLSRGRIGAVLAGLLTGLLVVSTQAGWMVAIAIDVVRVTGFSPEVSTAIAALPSSWALHAVTGAPVATLGWLVGLAVLAGGLLVGWAGCLGQAAPVREVIRGSRKPRTSRISGPVRTVVRTELRAWWRDPGRLQALMTSVTFALVTAALPLLAGSPVLLPWAGCFAAVMLTAVSANSYGHDGTSLWLGLHTRDDFRADVTGRAVALLVVGLPLALGVAAAGMGLAHAWSGAAVLTTVVATVLGAGVSLLIAVRLPAVGPDPRQARAAPGEHADVTGQSFAALALHVLLIAPAVVAALSFPAPWPLALAGSAAMAYAVATTAGMLRLAAHHLNRHAPELLHQMRTRRSTTTPESDEAAEPVPWPVWALAIAAIIALVPQAAVPAAMKLSGEVAAVWFVALHLPPVWQWPAIVAMAVLGVGLAVAAAGWYQRTTRPRVGSTPGIHLADDPTGRPTNLR